MNAQFVLCYHLSSSLYKSFRSANGLTAFTLLRFSLSVGMLLITVARLYVYLVEESVSVVLSTYPEHRIGILLAVRAEDQPLALGHEVLRGRPLLGLTDS